VGAPPRNGEAAFPLSFAQGRQSQSDGQPHRDGSNLPTYASAGLDTSFAALAPWRAANSATGWRTCQPSPRTPPSGSRTARRRRPDGEVAAAWQGKELLRAVYAVVDMAAARTALDRFYRWQTASGWRSRHGLPHRQGLGGRDPRLPRHRRPLQRAHRGRQPAHQEVKRVGHGFHNFANNRLQLLLHCGVTWQTHPTARLRDRSPRLVA
jgi:hypothetical protein